MSSNHKTTDRRTNQRDSRPNNNKRGERIVDVKKLRDGTKKAGPMMESLCRAFWERKPFINGTSSNVNNELEVKFNTPRYHNPRNGPDTTPYVPPLTRNDYDNVISKLQSLGFSTVNDAGAYMLRIQPEFLDSRNGTYALSKVRVEIRGFAAIQEYCVHNDINKILDAPIYSRAISMHKKSDAKHPTTGANLSSANFMDFHFKVSYSTEEEYSLVSRFGIAKSTVDSWQKSKKAFRYINRVTFTHPDYPVKVDISIVKSAGMRPDTRAYTTSEAGVFLADEAYEVEVEVDNSMIGIGTPTENVETLIVNLRKCIKYVLMGIQETSYPVPVSDQLGVAEEYLRLIGIKHGSRLFSNHFIGPSSFTLQRGNITDDTAEDYNSNMPNVRNNYTVTDKADGERRLLFIANTGLVYLINTNMKILFTGAKTENKLFYNTLLDGEIITHDKHGKFINLFAAFDVYMVNGKNVRSHVFYREISNDETDDKHQHKSRHHILVTLMKEIILSSVVPGPGLDPQERVQSPLRVSVKQFYASSPTKSIFAGCATILDRVDNELFEYTTDGLIFTPSDMGVGADEVGKVGDLNKLTWARSFKWKPAEFNTVDFLVTVKMGDDNRPIKKTMFASGLDAANTTQLKQYKTLILMCGFEEKQHGYINPCQDVYDDNIPTYHDATKSDTPSNYRPMQFFPTNPYDINGGICNVMLRKDGNGDEQMYTEENEVFDEQMIVEFRYEMTNDALWQWIPLRVRYDKTNEFRRKLNNFGNAYNVANSNWFSIHSPITHSMIRTGLGIPATESDNDVYYNRVNKNKMSYHTNSLRDFHNLYVKMMLITKVSRPGDTLIDVACGKGGDFSKWIQARLSFVFGVDLSPDNIENRLDGACARFLNLKKKTKTMPSALFVVGNSQMNIRTGESMTEKAKQITASVFGRTPKNVALGKGVAKHYGVGEDGFNVTSCQFALHYFFEDKHILHRFIRNVVECTKVGGYFVGTCYDGKRIFNMLKGKKNGDEVELHHANTSNKIWGVKKLYDEDTFEDDRTSVGYTISVYQETINKAFEEYLVNFDYLIRVMENYGFQVLTDVDAKRIGLPSGCGLFEDLFKQMTSSKLGRGSTEFGTAANMTANEKEISFKNRYFVFKKISNVNIDRVTAEELGDRDAEIPIESEIASAHDIAVAVAVADEDEDADQVVADDIELVISEKPSSAQKKRTISVRKPRKLNKSIVLQGATTTSK